MPFDSCLDLFLIQDSPGQQPTHLAHDQVVAGDCAELEVEATPSGLRPKEQVERIRIQQDIHFSLPASPLSARLTPGLRRENFLKNLGVRWERQVTNLLNLEDLSCNHPHPDLEVQLVHLHGCHKLTADAAARIVISHSLPNFISPRDLMKLEVTREV